MLLSKLQKYLSKLQNVCVQIAKYMPKLKDVFVQIPTCICLNCQAKGIKGGGRMREGGSEPPPGVAPPTSFPLSLLRLSTRPPLLPLSAI